MDEAINDLDEKTFNYLLSANHVLKWENSLQLKNYMKIHSAFLSERLGIKLPNSWTNKNNTCQFCCSPWLDGKYSVKLLPAKSCKRRMRKLLNKDPNKLKIIEKRLVALAKDSSGCNKLVLTCHICRNTTPFIYSKPKKPSQQTPRDMSTERKKRKKKKKDKLAGLTPLQDIFKIITEDVSLDGDTEQLPKTVPRLSSGSAASRTPLGIAAASTPSSSALSFIPLSSGSGKKEKNKTEIARKRPSLVLNPYASPSGAGLAAQTTPKGKNSTKKTNKNKLQQMLLESQQQSSSKGSGFKDFLSLCK